MKSTKITTKAPSIKSIIATLTLSLISFTALADGVGFLDGTRSGQIPANRGYRRTTVGSIQHVMVYLEAGEKLSIDIQRISTTGGVGSPMEITVYSPNGLEDTYEIDHAVPTTTITNNTYNVSASETGIWTIIVDGVVNSVNWRYDINALTAADERVDGRVFTERLYTTQNTPFTFSMHHINKLGHKFESTFNEFHGIDAIIQTNLFGATDSGICVPLYRSRDGYQRGPSCGEQFKQFFTEPNASLPDSAYRYDMVSATTYKDWLVPNLSELDTYIDTISFSYSLDNAHRPKKGVFSFAIENFNQIASLLIDVNNNGVYTDPEDRNLSFLAGAFNEVSFDGLDGAGNPIPCGTPLQAKVLIDRGGEIHFTMEDVEGLGGLTVTRTNGLDAPNSILFWDDRSLEVKTGMDTYAPDVADRDGRAGADSDVPGGVHGWTFNSTYGWGNDRLIDNWAIFPIASEERSIVLENNITCDIIAIDDDYRGTPVQTGPEEVIMGNILTNDTIYGIGNIPRDKVILTILAEATPNYPSAPTPYIDPTTGIVKVAPHTPSGIYEMEYQICDIQIPENCSTASVFVAVENTIVAVNDTFFMTPGSTTTTIFANDTLYGTAPTEPQITTTVLTPLPEGITLHPDGTVTVDPEVPGGTYTFDYEICERNVVPENCSTATVVIFIESPLPIELMSFDVKKEQDYGLLMWSTASEHNNKGFSIEKSIDGIQWSILDFVGTKANNGNSQEKLDYQYKDANPFSGISYYRLKQEDIDGKFDYSPVRQLVYYKNDNFVIYPNPARQQISITGIEAGTEIRLLDYTGRLISSKTAHQGANVISLQGVSAGTYLLQFVHDNQVISAHTVTKEN
jgi:hypothetical protein